MSPADPPAPDRSASAGGAVLVLTGAALFGTVGTAKVLGPAIPAPVAGAGRLLLAAALFLVVALAAGQGAALRRTLRASAWSREVLWAGAGQAAFQLCFLAAVESVGVATGTLIAIGCAPLLTGLLTRQVTGTWLIATAVAVAGLVLLVGGAAERPQPLGVLAAFGASLSYAVYITGSHRLAAHGGPTLAGLSAIFAVAAVLLLPVFALSPAGALWSVTGLLTVGYLAVVPTVLAYGAFNLGLRFVPAPTAATLGLVEPVIATALGVVLLQERLGAAGWLGAGLVLAGLAVLVQAQARGGRKALTGPAG